MKNMFGGCTSLETVIMNLVDTTACTDMTNMFIKCLSIKEISTPKTSGSVTSSLPIAMYDSDGTEYTALPTNATAV